MNVAFVCHFSCIQVSFHVFRSLFMYSGLFSCIQVSFDTFGIPQIAEQQPRLSLAVMLEEDRY